MRIEEIYFHPPFVKVQANRVGRKKELSKILVENAAVKASRRKLFVKVSHR